MYQVITRDETTGHDTRATAIAEAKDLSGRHRGDVEVLDPNGRERMTFRNGALESYVFELRDRKEA